ncbi:MAG: hypothetical protein IAF00_04790 [Phycisphaerales bacterium]|nr:hypothetical protein [Phycisphaerales bacterium]
MPFRWLAILSLGLLVQSLHAQPASPPPTTTPTTVESPAQPADTSLSQEAQLQALLKTIQDAETQQADLNQQLKRVSAPAETQQLNAQIKEITNQIKNLQTSFEEIATGGTSSTDLQQKASTHFNWQQEIEDIIRPLLDAMKQITERPRMIEHLRSERAEHENRLGIIDSAIAHIKKTLAATKNSSVKKALQTTLDQWHDYHEETESRLQRIQIQFERLIKPNESISQRLVLTFQEFASGRGLNLVLAVGGFLLTYLILSKLGRLIGKIGHRGGEKTTRQLARVTALFFKIMTTLIAFFVAALVLYARGDWLLLGLSILVAIGIMWSLQQSLPRYMTEIRALLDLGSVREGERIVYAGIPWKIVALNIYSILHNPLLRGGTLRLPLDQLVNLQSRSSAPEEPWFPSQENDFVILDDDLYGKVLMQTPEVVRLQAFGAIKTFAVTDYLSKNPRNLSLDGFSVSIIFGLDYCHQAEILSKIVPQLHAYLLEQLQQQPFAPHIKDLLVEFNEAAASSLNLLILAVCTGAGAEHYWSIRRFLQRTTVSACNQYHWNIPFDQLAVHLPPTQPLPLINP